MNILEQFLRNSTILEKISKVEELCDYIKDIENKNVKPENLEKLNFSLMRINEMMFKERLYSKDLSLKTYLEKISFIYNEKISNFKSNSIYEMQKSYNEEDLYAREQMIKETYFFDLLKVYIDEEKKSPELSVLLNKTIECIEEERIVYNKLKEKTVMIMENPLKNLDELYNEVKMQENEFRNSDVFKDIDECFYEQERIFRLTSSKIMDERWSLRTEYLKDISLDKDLETKKRIYTTYIKIYALSLQKSTIARIMYYYFCNASYIKIMSMFFDDTQQKIKNSVRKDIDTYKIFGGKKNDTELEEENESKKTRIENDLLFYKEQIKSFRMNIMSILEFINYSSVQKNPLVLNIRKKGLGLFASFNHTYENTLLLKKTDEERFDLITSNNLTCSFLNKERFMVEIENDSAKEYIFPNVKEKFIILLEN